MKKTECRYQPGTAGAQRPAAGEPSARANSSPRGRASAAPSAAPIFIVGLPRSGSTLIEQILASHSQVEGTMELADIPRLVQELQGREPSTRDPRYPGVLADLERGGLPAARREIPRATPACTAPAKPRFIDKMPNNFRHLGLIHLMLPNAKIIDARREPMACCFSNFKQLFASGQQFTYSIEDIARYYRMYVELMAHWDAALPGRSCASSTRTWSMTSRATCAASSISAGSISNRAAWSSTRPERTVHSASSEQVRRPIYREGVDQWRHYEPWLGPLKSALGPLAAPAG